MPAVPELGNVGLEIGRGKILRKLDASQAGDADGDIGVTAEVEINLKCVRVHDDPHPASRPDLRGKQIVDRDQCQGVCHHEFLE